MIPMDSVGEVLPTTNPALFPISNYGCIASVCDVFPLTSVFWSFLIPDTPKELDFLSPAS